MTHESEILSRIKKTVLEREPTAKIYLFGSRARGEAKADSDWDLLILLNQENITHAIEDTIRNPLYDVELEAGEVFSAIIYPEKEWFRKHSVSHFLKMLCAKEGCYDEDCNWNTKSLTQPL